MLVTGNDHIVFKKLISQLNDIFSIKHISLATNFLSIHIQTLPNGYFLNQQKYATKLLYKVGLWNAKSVHNLLPIKSSQFQVSS